MKAKNLFDITDKVIVITGGYGVLGASISAYLSENGAKVVIIGRNKEKGNNLISQINAKGNNATFLQADVLDKEQLEEACQNILKIHGQIDVLINAAGGNMPGATIPPDKTIFDLNLDDFRKVVDVNLFGTVIPSLVFAKAMTDKGSGCIINFASEAALRPLSRVCGYGAAKSAVVNFTKYLSAELSSKFKGCYKVNALVPGFFITDQNRDLLLNKDGSYTSRSESILRHTPLGRFGETDELLGSVHYLISDASKFVTGSLLVVDGGFDAFSI